MEDYSYNYQNEAKTHVMFEINGVIHALFKLVFLIIKEM